MIANSNNTPTKVPPITRKNCGTIGGGKSHRWRNELFCEPCKIAKREYDKTFYKKNSQKIIASTERYRKANLDKQRQWSAAYRNKNLEKVRETSRRYGKENPEKIRENARKRRALVRNSESLPYTEAQVLTAYGLECYLCKSLIDLNAPRNCRGIRWEFGLHIDHVVPIVSGGPDTLENVRPTHAICNMKKGDKMPEDFEVEIDPSLFEDEDVELEDLDLEDFEDDEEEEDE
jgi:5-methylcytosine-specific restriction endonuclease McrA